MAQTFFHVIGGYNLFGAFVVLALLSPRVAAAVLGPRGLQIAANPYRPGEYEPLWICWSSSSTAFFGAVVLAAAGWPPAVQRWLAVAVALAYAMMLVPAVGAYFSPRYRRSGLWAVYVLWPAQIAWALAVAWKLR